MSRVLHHSAEKIASGLLKNGISSACFALSVASPCRFGFVSLLDTHPHDVLKHVDSADQWSITAKTRTCASLSFTLLFNALMYDKQKMAKGMWSSKHHSHMLAS